MTPAIHEALRALGWCYAVELEPGVWEARNPDSPLRCRGDTRETALAGLRVALRAQIQVAEICAYAERAAYAIDERRLPCFRADDGAYAMRARRPHDAK